MSAPLRSAATATGSGRAPERLAVVWCPQWPIVAAGAAADEPVAVLHANRVIACSVAAAAADVRLGLRRREAQARCPEVRLVAHDPVAERRAFHPVADAVAELVPRLELAEPGALVFATRGPSRYFGGDAAMAARVLATVDAVLADTTTAAGRPAIGLGDGRFTARVAAQLAAGPTGRRVCVVDPGTAPSFLAELALPWLTHAGEVDADLVELFARLGLRTLGQVAALPAADVLARFGHPGSHAWHLAAGRDDRPHGAEDPPDGLTVAHHFDAPIPQLDTVVFAGRRLAEQLTSRLADAGRVCTRFVATAETDHGEVSERVWSLSTGFTATTIVERLRWQLDGWARFDPSRLHHRDLGDPDDPDDPDGPDPLVIAGVATSGIVHLRLEPAEVRADDGVQLGLWGGRRQADDWAQRAATRLAGLVGDAQVVVAEWRGGRHPSDVHRWVPASSSARLDPGHDPAGRTGGADRASGTGGTSGTGGPRRPPWPGALAMPSPATVHVDPVAVQLLDDRGQQVAVSGRGIISAPPASVRGPDGSRRRIVAWAGPWLVDERWWDPARRRRLARVQFVTDDAAAHLAALEGGQWWLTATYD
ncbi:MAG: DNA polymerase Y family protein [Acidimicrobiales bacterium]|nr:DNA polymerase Y family protein [Acidimicrobiales bacterium]MCB9395123.1 DNA polymerase Y family protein [Acidimicrobiaceae bacterium]